MKNTWRSYCRTICIELTVCQSDCLTCQPPNLSTWHPDCLSVCLTVWLSVCLSVCLSACLPACLSVCLPNWLPVNHPAQPSPNPYPASHSNPKACLGFKLGESSTNILVSANWTGKHFCHTARFAQHWNNNRNPTLDKTALFAGIST